MLTNARIQISFVVCGESSDMGKTVATSRTVLDLNGKEISQMAVEKSWRRVSHVMLLRQLTLAEVSI